MRYLIYASFDASVLTISDTAADLSRQMPLMYDNFGEAVTIYAKLCSLSNHVVFADLEKETIIRQYAYEHCGNEYGNGVSNAICIF